MHTFMIHCLINMDDYWHDLLPDLLFISIHYSCTSDPWQPMITFVSVKLCRNDFLHRVWFGIVYSHENFRLLFGNSMVVIQTLFTDLTPLCHICWMVCSLAVTYDWFPVNHTLIIPILSSNLPLGFPTINNLLARLFLTTWRLLTW